MRGRRLTATLREAIFTGLAEGKTLRVICAPEGMPDRATVYRWLADDRNADFRDQYARARAIGLDLIADEVLEIADAPAGTEGGAQGMPVENRRLQIDARKWYLAKLAPKKYGEHLRADVDVRMSLAELVLAARKPQQGGAQ